MGYFYLAKECENLLIFVSTLLFVIFDYLKGRNFGGKKFQREENLADLAEFNQADAEKLKIWREFNLADAERL